MDVASDVHGTVAIVAMENGAMFTYKCYNVEGLCKAQPHLIIDKPLFGDCDGNGDGDGDGDGHGRISRVSLSMDSRLAGFIDGNGQMKVLYLDTEMYEILGPSPSPSPSHDSPITISFDWSLGSAVYSFTKELYGSRCNTLLVLQNDGIARVFAECATNSGTQMVMAIHLSGGDGDGNGDGDGDNPMTSAVFVEGTDPAQLHHQRNRHWNDEDDDVVFDEELVKKYGAILTQDTDKKRKEQVNSIFSAHHLQPTIPILIPMSIPIPIPVPLHSYPHPHSHHHLIRTPIPILIPIPIPIPVPIPIPTPIAISISLAIAIPISQAQRREEEASSGIGCHHERRLTWILCRYRNGDSVLQCVSGLYARPRPKPHVQKFVRLIGRDGDGDGNGPMLLCTASFVRSFTWERAPGFGLGLDSWSRPPTPYCLRVVTMGMGMKMGMGMASWDYRLKERRTHLISATGGHLHTISSLKASPEHPFVASMDSKGMPGYHRHRHHHRYHHRHIIAITIAIPGDIRIWYIPPPNALSSLAQHTRFMLLHVISGQGYVGMAWDGSSLICIPKSLDRLHLHRHHHANLWRWHCNTVAIPSASAIVISSTLVCCIENRRLAMGSGDRVCVYELSTMPIPIPISICLELVRNIGNISSMGMASGMVMVGTSTGQLIRLTMGDGGLEMLDSVQAHHHHIDSVRVHASRTIVSGRHRHRHHHPHHRFISILRHLHLHLHLHLRPHLPLHDPSNPSPPPRYKLFIQSLGNGSRPNHRHEV